MQPEPYEPRDAPSKAQSAAVKASFLPVFSRGDSSGSGGGGGGGGGNAPPVPMTQREGPYWDGVLNLGMFDWFHGLLEIEDVQELLKGEPKGAFLVRVSAKTGKYVIVWVSDASGKLVHILIDTVSNDPVNRYFVESKGGKELYRNVPAVIQRFSKKYLTKPISATKAKLFDAELRQHRIDTNCNVG